MGEAPHGSNSLAHCKNKLIMFHSATAALILALAASGVPQPQLVPG